MHTEVSSCRAFRPGVPNLFGTRDWFLGSHFFPWTSGRGMVSGRFKCITLIGHFIPVIIILWKCGNVSDGEWLEIQMNLHLLACCSSLAVCPGSKQAKDPDWSVALLEAIVRTLLFTLGGMGIHWKILSRRVTQPALFLKRTLLLLFIYQTTGT